MKTNSNSQHISLCDLGKYLVSLSLSDENMDMQGHSMFLKVT